MTDRPPSSSFIKPGAISNVDAVLLFINFGIGGGVVAGAVTFYYIGLILGLLIFSLSSYVHCNWRRGLYSVLLYLFQACYLNS